jgi:hypothetical protein
VEAAPRQPVEPGRNIGLDDRAIGGIWGAHQA